MRDLGFDISRLLSLVEVPQTEGCVPRKSRKLIKPATEPGTIINPRVLNVDDLLFKMVVEPKACRAPQRLLFGWFAPIIAEDGSPIMDFDGQVTTVPELEAGVYNYVLDYREAGERHQRTTGIGELIESMMFTREKFAALVDTDKFPEGPEVLAKYLPQGWWGGFLVHDQDVLNRVLSGEYESFSIGGTNRIKVAGGAL